MRLRIVSDSDEILWWQTDQKVMKSVEWWIRNRMNVNCFIHWDQSEFQCAVGDCMMNNCFNDEYQIHSSNSLWSFSNWFSITRQNNTNLSKWTFVKFILTISCFSWCSIFRSITQLPKNSNDSKTTFSKNRMMTSSFSHHSTKFSPLNSFLLFLFCFNVFFLHFFFFWWKKWWKPQKWKERMNWNEF